MIWAALAVIWALQASAALLVHRTRPAVVMYGMAVLFAATGAVVRSRMVKR